MKDHTHCWNQHYPKDTHPEGTACGILPEKHKQCCLCGESAPVSTPSDKKFIATKYKDEPVQVFPYSTPSEGQAWGNGVAYDATPSEGWKKDLESILIEWEGKSNPFMGAWRVSERFKRLSPLISQVAKEQYEAGVIAGRDKAIGNLEIRYDAGFEDGKEAMREKAVEWVDSIFLDELHTAHTTKSGKTSRLTSAYNRLKALLSDSKGE